MTIIVCINQLLHGATVLRLCPLRYASCKFARLAPLFSRCNGRVYPDPTFFTQHVKNPLPISVVSHVVLATRLHHISFI